MNAVLDLGISLSPILILWNIQMRTRKKVAICGLMSLGLIATGMNITRTVLLKDVNTDVTCRSLLCAEQRQVSETNALYQTNSAVLQSLQSWNRISASSPPVFPPYNLCSKTALNDLVLKCIHHIPTLRPFLRKENKARFSNHRNTIARIRITTW